MDFIKFEHRKQRVAPFTHFIKRLTRYTLFAFALIFLSLLFGVLGYMHFGNLNLVDSFHMSSMILTGMGPVAEMKTNAAKGFSSIYALYSGVAFLTITAVFFAPIVHRVLHILQVENDEWEKKD